MSQNQFPARFLLTGAFVAGALTLHAADWTQYRGPNHDGSTSEAIQLRWPASGPKVVWKTPTPNGFSSFAVAGGLAYTQVARDEGGVPSEVCVALDANTGKEVWAVRVGGVNYGHQGGNEGTADNKGGDGPRSTPSVDGGRVYVLSSDLALYCLDAKTGKQIWLQDLMRAFAGRNITWKNAASPLIDGSLVYVAGGGPGQSFIAFNKQSGAPVWKSGSETITHSTPVLTTIHGVKQVIFFVQSGLVSLDAASGKELWKYPFRFRISTAMTPVVSGDTVFLSAGYDMGGAAAKITKQGNSFTATQIWDIAGHKGDSAVANHWSTPVLKDGHMYGMFQFKEYGAGPVKCVEIATGKVKWQRPGFGPGNVVRVGDSILALSDAGEIVSFEATSSGYKEISRAKVLTGKCWSTPVVSNGRIYVRSTTEAVCLDVAPRAAALP
jgi:outer membrane protein assembly factor BamB